MIITIDGVDVEYDANTVFRTEVGKGKGAYKDIRYTEVGYPLTASRWYKGVNIGNGYKKRFVMIKDGKRTVICRKTS